MWISEGETLMKLFQIAKAIVVTIAIIAGLSSAQSQNSGLMTVEGNIGDVFSLSLDTTHGYITVSNSNDGTLPANLIITSNGPWQVMAKADNQGQMAEWDPSSGDSGSYVANPAMDDQHMRVMINSNPLNINGDITLSGSDQILIPSNNNYGTQILPIILPITFIQPRNSWIVRLNPPHYYRIAVTFTGSMSY